MILINELLPNPTGKDAENEFIELYNGGQEPVNLTGHSLRDKSGKIFKLTGIIDAQGFKVLYRKETKISLNNSDEEIFLYDGNGEIQRVGFLGQAKEGASFSWIGEGFIFSELATPGGPNQAKPIFQIDGNLRQLSSGNVIYNDLSFFSFITVMIFIALLFGLGAAYLTKWFTKALL